LRAKSIFLAALVTAAGGAWAAGGARAAVRSEEVVDRTVYRIPITSETSAHIDSAEWTGGAYSTRAGVFNHIAGRGKGHFTFRIRRKERYPVRGVSVSARVSSDYPGCTTPPDGFSDVTCRVNSVDVGTLRVVRDNSRGRATTWSAPNTSAVAFSGDWLTVTLSVSDDAAMANGLCIYSQVPSYSRCAVTPIAEESRIPLTVTLHHSGPPPKLRQKQPEDDPDYVDWSKHRRVVELTNPVDNSKQKVMICLPRVYDPRRPSALIVHHHSHGAKHDDISKMGLWHPLASSYNCILVSGDLHGNAWGNETSLADLDAIIRHVRSKWSIDSTRIYAHGNSMGGAITVHMGRNPSLYAAGVVVHGVTDLRRFHAQASARPRKPFVRSLEKAMGGGPSAAYDRSSGMTYARSLAKTPILFYHGEADRIVPPDHSLRLAEEMVKHGGTARVVVVPQWGHAYQIADDLEFMDFLFKYRKVQGRAERVRPPAVLSPVRKGGGR